MQYISLHRGLNKIYFVSLHGNYHVIPLLGDYFGHDWTSLHCNYNVKCLNKNVEELWPPANVTITLLHTACLKHSLPSYSSFKWKKIILNDLIVILSAKVKSLRKMITMSKYIYFNSFENSLLCWLKTSWLKIFWEVCVFSPSLVEHDRVKPGAGLHLY